MNLRLYWLFLWILFVVIEMFFLTLDFLALWVSAIITALVVYLFKLDNWNLWQIALLFLLLWVLMIYISRKYFLPKLKKDDNTKWTMSIETIIWDNFIVQDIEWKNVVYHEWVYWKVVWDDTKPWDTVEVIEIMTWNTFKVKKKI